MGVTVREKKKGSGVWWVFINHKGNRKAKVIGKDKRFALEVAENIKARLVLGDLGIFSNKESEVPKFKQYADLWLHTTVMATCKDSTIGDYKSILRKHILPVFKNKSLDMIKRGNIKTFLLEKINTGYAPNTVCHMKDVLSGVFNKALEDEIIQANPALNLGKIFKTQNKKKKIDPLSNDELKHLLGVVRKEFYPHYPLILLLARTGLRIGEALALKWCDIDFHGRFIDVEQNIVRGEEDTTKNSQTRRVDMSLQLTETLKIHRKQCKELGIKLGLGQPPEHVFVNQKGRCIDKDNWRNRVFKKAVDKAGLRHIRIHDMRHTYATLRISKGDSIEDVSNQLGHHSPKFTWDTYYHWKPGKKKHEVDGLDDPSYVHQDAPYPQPQIKKA